MSIIGPILCLKASIALSVSSGISSGLMSGTSGLAPITSNNLLATTGISACIISSPVSLKAATGSVLANLLAIIALRLFELLSMFPISELLTGLPNCFLSQST